MLQVAQLGFKGSFRDLWLRWMLATFIGCIISSALGFLAVWVFTITQPVPLYDIGFNIGGDIERRDGTWRRIWQFLNPLFTVWWMLLSAYILTRLQLAAIKLTFPTALSRHGSITLMTIFAIPGFLLITGLSVMLMLGSADTAVVTPLGLGLVTGLILGYLQSSLMYGSKVSIRRRSGWIIVALCAWVAALYAFAICYLALGGPTDTVAPKDPLQQAGIVLLSGMVGLLVAQGVTGFAFIRSKLENSP